MDITVFHEVVVVHKIVTHKIMFWYNYLQLISNSVEEFALFQCWLQRVVFYLKRDFLSKCVLILIILNLSL